MHHFTSLDNVALKNTWLTIGSFDGIHLGHQAIIRNLTAGAHAAGAQAVVFTFYPHPSVVLGKRRNANALTTPEERAVILAEMDVDVLVTYPFNLEVAQRSARDFLVELQDRLDFQQLWVGQDFAMGHNREGNVPRLRELGKELGFRLHVIPPVEIDGERVSSSRIRALLSVGDVAAAARLLGRPYSLAGIVERGDGRGSQIGIPTANLAVPSERLIPAIGGYACRARLRTGVCDAVANIGVRPTFKDSSGQLTVEAHLLDFKGDLYGQRMELDFIAWLRGEHRYPSAEALIAQINKDIVRARELLKAVA